MYEGFIAISPFLACARTHPYIHIIRTYVYINIYALSGGQIEEKLYKVKSLDDYIPNLLQHEAVCQSVEQKEFTMQHALQQRFSKCIGHILVKIELQQNEI